MADSKKDIIFRFADCRLSREQERELLALKSENKFYVFDKTKNSQEDVFSEIRGHEGRIILYATEEDYKKFNEALYKRGIHYDKLIHYEDYLKTRSEVVIKKQISIIEQILASDDKSVKDYGWMRDIICKYGVYPFTKNVNKETGSVLWTSLGVLQTIDEFTRFCNYIGSVKIENAIEVGVMRGRSSYLICALLTRNNPRLTYRMVDITDYLGSEFEDFRQVLPSLQKEIPKTSDDYAGEVYDFVFIDGDHSYDGSIKDFYNLGIFAKKITVFHDIYGHEYDDKNGGGSQNMERGIRK